MNEEQAPALAELRAYGLGESGEAAAARITHYLLVSGDERAIQLVAAFNRARLRVDAWKQAQQTAEWPQVWLEKLGLAMTHQLHALQAGLLELVSSPALGATLTATTTAHAVAPSPRQLQFKPARPDSFLYYLLLADATGHWRIEAVARPPHPPALIWMLPSSTTWALAVVLGSQTELPLQTGQPLENLTPVLHPQALTNSDADVSFTLQWLDLNAYLEPSP